MEYSYTFSFFFLGTWIVDGLMIGTAGIFLGGGTVFVSGLVLSGAIPSKRVILF